MPKPKKLTTKEKALIAKGYKVAVKDVLQEVSFIVSGGITPNNVLRKFENVLFYMKTLAEKYKL